GARRVPVHRVRHRRGGADRRAAAGARGDVQSGAGRARARRGAERGHGLASGGGKSVIIRPKARFDRVALFRAFGRFIDDLRGHYITAEDSGTGLEDMEVLRTVTKYVTGVHAK